MGRALTISVKGTDGEWTTMTVLEVRFAQPIKAFREETQSGWIVGIRSAETPDAETGAPAGTP